MHMHTRHLERRHGWRRHHRDDERHGPRRFFGHGRGGRSVRRGNVRRAILSVLSDRPMHGYQVITELESRTNGRWRPSAGSVYPTLQLLEDEGLLRSEEVEGRRTYSLTDAGRQAAEEHPLETDGADDAPDVDRQLRSVAEASMQIQRFGTPEANTAAREILAEARRKLYLLLAEDETEAPS
jgi:DNA-binding PadR family transcriptional regulator